MLHECLPCCMPGFNSLVLPCLIRSELCCASTVCGLIPGVQDDAVAPPVAHEPIGGAVVAKEYTIGAVVGHEFTGARAIFKVRWGGKWGKRQHTWEPLSNFSGSGKRSISRYVRAYRKAQRLTANEVLAPADCTLIFVVQSGLDSIRRKLIQSSWSSLYQQARMCAPANSAVAVSTSLKQLLPGKFAAPMYGSEIKRLLHLLKHRAGPNEKKVTAAGLLPTLKHFKTKQQRMSFAGNMSWRVNTLAELRILPVCSPEVMIYHNLS
jgi:hypothetical protein